MSFYYDDGGRHATSSSWHEDYVGEAHKALYEVISLSADNPYARYQAIVQSSGMGKSRLVDELAREHLVIPVNLRSSGTGFPPGDGVNVLLHSYNEAETYKHSQAFLIGIFEAAYETLEDITAKIGNVSPQERQKVIAREFREQMIAGQTFEGHGEKHVQFYNKVRSHAVSAITNRDQFTARDMTSPELRSTLIKLLSLLDPTLPSVENGLSTMPPMLILAFDEAHTLLTSDTSPLPWMRRALRQITKFPLFTLFISTSAAIHEATPPPKGYPSKSLPKGELLVFPPFTELGFDQMIQADKLQLSSERFDIDDVSTVGFMSRFGRPLFGSRHKHGFPSDQREILDFAVMKLTGGRSIDHLELAGARFACMSVRLGLEFNSITPVIRARELEQVEKYMRVCLAHDGFERAVTLSPSEPLLAEAARSVMYQRYGKFDVPGSLFEQLDGLGVEKGDRGELIAELLLILASDAAFAARRLQQRDPIGESSPKLEFSPTAPRAVSLESFIKALLAEKWHEEVFNSNPSLSRNITEGQQSFGAIFKDSKVYFNHFIRAKDSIIDRDFLWKLIARGAAVVFENGLCDMDIVIPFMFRPGKLSRRNISAIFLRMKDETFGEERTPLLFDLMNPYLQGFFGLNEEPLPVIRMVFTLGSPTSAVDVIPPLVERPQEAEETPAAANTVKRSPRYTAYDFSCDKATCETFGVIAAKDDETYGKLVKICKGFQATYTEDSAECVRRNMNPGTASEVHYWDGFCVAGKEDEDMADVVDVDQ